MAISDEERQQRVASTLRRVCGGVIEVERVVALTGGAASMTFGVDARRDGEPWLLILQCASLEGATLSRRSQAELMQLAAAHGILVPRVVAVLDPGDRLGEGFITERVPGESLAPRWLRSPDYATARGALTGQLAIALARLHAIPLREGAAIGLASESPAESREAMFERYRSYGVNSPVIELAFAWLAERMPDAPPRAIVHGDFRSGNFLVNEHGLTAVLDWELAHLGDPLEDLTWISTNAWRFGEWRHPVGGFGQREAFYDAYEAAGGGAVDREAARIFELWGSVRWGVMCLQMAHAHLSGVAVSVERAAIGRRVAENEIDILHILKHGSV